MNLLLMPWVLPQPIASLAWLLMSNLLVLKGVVAAFLWAQLPRGSDREGPGLWEGSCCQPCP